MSPNRSYCGFFYYSLISFSNFVQLSSTCQSYTLCRCGDYTNALKPESAGKIKHGAVGGSVYGFSQLAVFCSFAVLFYVGSQLLVQLKVDFAEFFTIILAVMVMLAKVSPKSIFMAIFRHHSSLALTPSANLLLML